MGIDVFGVTKINNTSPCCFLFGGSCSAPQDGRHRYSLFRLGGRLCSISTFQHFSLIVFFASQIHYSADPVVYWGRGGGQGDSHLKWSFIALYDDISLKGKVFNLVSVSGYYKEQDALQARKGTEQNAYKISKENVSFPSSR